MSARTTFSPADFMLQPQELYVNSYAQHVTDQKMSADFEELLDFIKEKRLRASTSSSTGILRASESDKSRVINSSAFRRLQQKAQVFPLEPNAAVRTRLSHSIEVSQIGRYLSQEVINKYSPSQYKYEDLTAFTNIVETACLLHDIGNPPFGHLGESAIKEWFNSNKPGLFGDLVEFDGNPQGFRLISFLSGVDNFGLNLTCTALLSTIKYPWAYTNKPTGKKIGLFSSDFSNYENACSELGWEAGHKFPFMRLMDAADEIAYSMSDLEDGIEKKIITWEKIREKFSSYTDFFIPTSPLSPFLNFKTTVINRAVKTAADHFHAKLDNILNRNSEEDIELLKDSEVGRLLKEIKNFARDEIYSHEHAERIELAGRRVVQGLLNHFNELLELHEDNFVALINNNYSIIKENKLDFQIRLLHRLPNSYIEKYRQCDRGSEPERRAHLIVDFISSMTDDFALETYQILEGIRLK